VPWRLTPFPEDHWLQVVGGEAVCGFFKYPGGEDAIYVANHNAFAPQEMVVALRGPGTENAVLELFDRETGDWKPVEKNRGVHSFPLRPAGGELLRVRRRLPSG